MEELLEKLPAWASGTGIGIFVFGALQGYKLWTAARHQGNQDDLSSTDRISAIYESEKAHLNLRFLKQEEIIEGLRKELDAKVEACRKETEALRAQLHVQELHYANRFNEQDKKIAEKDFELRTAQQNLQHIGVLKDHLPLSVLREIIAEREGKDDVDHED